MVIHLESKDLEACSLRGSYGNPFGIKGPRGMFFNSYPRGFPATGGHFGGFSRGQAMQFYRPSLMKSNSSHSTIVPSMQSNKFDESISICQICHKQGHTADACWHRYDDAHLVSFNHFDKSKMMGPRAAYMTSYESSSIYMQLVEDHYATPYSSYDFMYYPSEAIQLEAYVANYEGSTDEW